MDWQPEPESSDVFASPFKTWWPADSARVSSARPKRWVLHARHGDDDDTGSVASSSEGPHLPPSPRRPRRAG